jgi:glycosyltransferase involved in cell wall biosynthesis
MRMLLIAPARARVAPDAGGPGGQVALLAEGLAARGHDVTVCTTEPCDLPVRVRRYKLPAPETAAEAARLPRLYAVRALGLADQFDVVHSFAGPEVAAHAAASGLPILVTLPATLSADDRAAWARFEGRYVALSWAQAMRTAEWLPAATSAGVVYPALPVDSLPYEPEHDGYLVALGPVGPAAGTDLALAAAAKAELPLVLLGPVAPGATEFFEQEVAPRIDGRWVQYRPVPSPDERRRLLERAMGALLTSRANRAWEPEAAEALAMGTPVTALDGGVARELVVHAETGFVGSDLAGLVSGLDRLDTIEPRACRRRAERCWDVPQIVSAYEAIYGGVLLGDRQASAGHPELEALDPRAPLAV